MKTDRKLSPFQLGQEAAKQDQAPNPFSSGSIEFHNFEVGRAYGLRHKPHSAGWLVLEEGGRAKQ